MGKGGVLDRDSRRGSRWKSVDHSELVDFRFPMPRGARHGSGDLRRRGLAGSAAAKLGQVVWPHASSKPKQQILTHVQALPWQSIGQDGVISII
jgi:hypothetical protein